MDQGTVAYILAQTQHQTMSRTLPGTHCPAMSCDVRIAVGITNVLLMLERLEPMGHDVMDRPSLNLSLFVEDQNGPGIGQTLPFSLCSRPLGLRPLVRSVPPARTHSDAESSARIERSPRILGGWFC
jgi:hypothetical protein